MYKRQVHVESDTEEKLHDAIARIHAKGKRAGVVLKPKTPAETVLPFLNEVELVLVMTVEPGFGGQKFMEDQVPKIKQLADWKKELGLKYDIEVDGGIYHANVAEVLDAGANIMVSGSGIFKGDIRKNTEEFMEILKSHE